MRDEPGVPRDCGARPSLDEVLAIRTDRVATVSRVRVVLTAGSDVTEEAVQDSAVKPAA